MSRNSKIRYMAEQLPPFPKLNGKRVQRDSSGNIIYVNHFRELKLIQDTMEQQGYGPKHPKTAKAWAEYASRVWAYDKWAKRKQTHEKILPWVLVVMATIAIAALQKYFNIKLL